MVLILPSTHIHGPQIGLVATQASLATPLSCLPLQLSRPNGPRKGERQQRKCSRDGERNPQGIAVYFPHRRLELVRQIPNGEDRLPQLLNELENEVSNMNGAGLLHSK